MSSVQQRRSRRWMGQWWILDNPGHRVGGVLEVDPAGRLRLELTDRLLDDGRVDGTADVVLGAADGRRLTLLNCEVATGGKFVIAQVVTATQVVRPQIAMIGIGLTDPNQPVFNGLEVAITGLTAWAGKTGLDSVYFARPDNNERAKLTVSWTEPVTAKITDPMEATIGLHWTVESSGPAVGNDGRTYWAEERTALRVKTDTCMPWDAFGETAVAMRDLVTVATQKPARITERTLLIDDYRIELYYRGSVDAQDEESDLDPSDIIFTLGRDVEFARIVERWMSLRKKIGLPLDVLLGLDYQRDGYYENRLFNSASAAEGFHTALFPETTEMPQQAHDALKQKLGEMLGGVSAIDRAEVEAAIAGLKPQLRQCISELLNGFADADRQWVMNRVGANRPGLKQRLTELTTLADHQAVSELLTDVETWAKWLRDGRNAIGHLNTGELQRRVPEDARFRLTFVTRALLHLIIIAELGISAEVQRSVVRKSWGYSAEQFGEAVNAARQPRL